MSKLNCPIVAAFDFDGTISYCDSLVPFLFSAFGFWKTSIDLLRDLPYFAGYLLGKHSRQETKERILTRSLKGIPMRKLQEKGAAYAQGTLRKLIRPDALNALNWHRHQGHMLVLISANLDIYLDKWGELAGFDHVVCSCLETDSAGNATGKLKGKNCRREEKTRRLVELLGPKSGYTLYAYGDSKGDKELLELADYPFYRSFPKIC